MVSRSLSAVRRGGASALGRGSGNAGPQAVVDVQDADRNGRLVDDE
jgi:hypothetical protein